MQWPRWMTRSAVCWLPLCLMAVVLTSTELYNDPGGKHAVRFIGCIYVRWMLFCCHNNPGGGHSVQSVGCLCVWWVLLWCLQSSTVALSLCLMTFFFMSKCQNDLGGWPVMQSVGCLCVWRMCFWWPWRQTSIAACRLPLRLNDVTLIFWCLQSNTKVLVAGPWCNVTAVYTCVFDDKHVAATLIQPGVLRCFTPGNGGSPDGSQPVFWLDS